jgi:hypothetical protein
LFRSSVLFEGAEQVVEQRREVFEANSRDELAAEALVLVRSTAEADLIAFFTVNLGAEESDVADVVLSARVRTAGDVEIEWLQNPEVFV